MDVGRTIVLLASSTVTATTTGSEIAVPEGYSKCRIRLNAGVPTGTSPTLNVYVQNGIRKPASGDTAGIDTTGTLEFNDFVSFTQLTATGTRYAGVVEASNFEAAAQDAALTAGSARNGPFGRTWRVKAVAGGTNPSWPTVTVIAEFDR